MYWTDLDCRCLVPCQDASVMSTSTMVVSDAEFLPSRNERRGQAADNIYLNFSHGMMCIKVFSQDLQSPVAPCDSNVPIFFTIIHLLRRLDRPPQNCTSWTSWRTVVSPRHPSRSSRRSPCHQKHQPTSRLVCTSVRSTEWSLWSRRQGGGGSGHWATG